MQADLNRPRLRQAVGVFDAAEALQEAADELESHGFDRADLSLLAGEHAVQAKLGHLYERVEDLEDDPDAPQTFFVSTESVGDAEGGLIGGLLYVGACAAAGAAVATGGPLAAVIGAAAVGGGAGGVIGGILAGLVGKHHADYLQNQLEHGGLLLWVDVRDAEHEKRALEILGKHSAHDVHVHEI
jgi:hypothetical protein